MMFRKALCAMFSLSFLLAGCGGSGSSPSGGTGSPENSPTAAPQIAGFSPAAGVEGTSVQISGLWFSSSPAGNTVRFNGVNATVLSATTTKIVVNVPAGATTGPVSITTSAGSATTADNFTVLDSTTPGVAWTTRTTGLRGRPAGIAWDGAKYVVGGDSIITSTDVVSWVERDYFSWVYDLKWNGQLFVGVGQFGNIQSSADGLTWTEYYGTSNSNKLYGVAYSDTLWVAVGDEGAILTSSDGLDWTPRTSPVSGGLTTLNDVAWNGSQFIAVGSDGVIITSPDGITWTEQTSGVTDTFTAVAATPALIVASNSVSGVYTSSNGVDWIQQDATIAPLEDIIYAGGQWVGVSTYSVARSADGINWSVSSNGLEYTPKFLEAVTYDGSQYVAVGGWEGSVYTSPDAITWSWRASEQDFHAIARRPSDGRLVAVSTSDVCMMSTDDGVTWQFSLLDPVNNYLFLDVAWFEPLNAFVALVQVAANEALYTSTDGLTWTDLGDAPLNGRLGASDTLLVSVGWDYDGEAIGTSTDGVNWNQQYACPAGSGLEEVAWTGSQFIAVGDNGAIVTSPDGVSWTPQSSGVTQTLYAAASSPTRQVAVGGGGTIVTSEDGGVTWVQQTSGTANRLDSVAWTGAEFVAVGFNGTVVHSTDGLNWTLQPTPYEDVLFGSDSFHLESIIWAEGSGHLVTVGTRGLAATSP